MTDSSFVLLRLVTRRPFRRSAVDAVTVEDIATKIRSHGLRFSLPFGGYKARGLASSPRLNWAEVLWLDYLRSYAEPMTALVDEEIEFALTYLSGVLCFINGTTDIEEEAYLKDLEGLARAMSGDGIRFRLVDLAEHLGGSAVALRQVVANYHQLRIAPPELTATKLASAARNCTIEAEAADAALRCEAMEMLPARRAFNKFGRHIQLTHVRGPSLSVHIGSCRSSVVQPWVGTGVFEIRDNGVLLPRIFGRASLASSVVMESNLDDYALAISPRARAAAAAFSQLKSVLLINANTARHDID